MPGLQKYHCAALAADKTIYAFPNNAGRVMRLDYRYRRVELLGPEFPGSGKWCTMAKGDDGCLYAPPFNFGHVLRVDCRQVPANVELVGEELYCKGGSAYASAVRGPDGCIYSPPLNAHRVL